MTSRAFGLSVKAFILDGDHRCLFLRRAKESKHNAGLWDLPGGKCEANETMEEALRREVYEETGFQVRLVRVAGCDQVELEDRTLAMLFVEVETIDAPEKPRVCDEHDGFVWQPLEKRDELKIVPSILKPLESFATLALKRPRRFDKGAYRQQVSAFTAVADGYETLKTSLISILKTGMKELGLDCIVTGRAKTLNSFAEKIVRPGKLYRDPLSEITDLCGVRVIASTLGHVAEACRYIDNTFQVYPEDSGDKAAALQPGEFGYLSTHFVVSLKPGSFPDLATRKKLDGLKAEVQVRTILQHAWADINHGLSYKNPFTLPRRLRREFHRLAAVLEAADRDFDAIRTDLLKYSNDYVLTSTEDQLRDELDKLETVAAVADPGAAELARRIAAGDDRDDADLAHRVAKIARSLEEWDRAIRVLEPFAESRHAALVRDLGVCLGKKHRKDPDGKKFCDAQKLLKAAIELDNDDVDAWASLGGTWRVRELAAAATARAAKKKADRAAAETASGEYAAAARKCYRRAFELDPTDPYPLGNYLEYEIAAHPDRDVVGYFRPSIDAARRRCEQQAEVRVNLPWAYFDLGKFELMLGEPITALRHYAKGVAESTAEFMLESALKSFPTLEAARRPLAGLAWSREFLTIARTALYPTPAAGKGPRHVTLAGDARADAAVEKALTGTKLRPAKTGSVDKALALWQDLAKKKIVPADVRVLAGGNDKMTSCECAVALALGATVGVLDRKDAGQPGLFADPAWAGHKQLKKVSPEIGAIRAFLQG